MTNPGYRPLLFAPINYRVNLEAAKSILTERGADKETSKGAAAFMNNAG